MKNKGFTLIELIGVISVLAILALIVSAPVTKILRDSNKKACEAQLDTIVTAAKLWGEEHLTELPADIGDSITITLQQLKKDGYVDNNIKNPMTKALLDNTMSIKIVKISKRRWEYSLVSTNLCK